MNTSDSIPSAPLTTSKHFALALSLSSALIAAVPTQVDAAIDRKSSIANDPIAAFAIQSPKQLQGDYGNLNDTFLTLQKKERQARASMGAQMHVRSIRFEEVREPNLMSGNGLSLYYNDARLFQMTLGKSLFQLTKFRSVTAENIHQIVIMAFSSQDDGTWLRKTKNGFSTEYTSVEFQEYLQGVARTRENLLRRLEDPKFRAYAVDRANVLIPRLENQGALGLKTLQSILSSTMSFADATLNAINQQKNGRSLAVNAMTVIDHANQMSRAAYLTDTQALPGGKPGSKKSPILRYHITVPATDSWGKRNPGSLIYTLAQRKNITEMLGDTTTAYGIAPEKVSMYFLKSFKESLSQIGTGK